MTTLVALDPNLHRHLRLNPELIPLSCRQVQMLPVVPAEFAQVASQTPIVLTKQGHTGQFVFVTLFGLSPGENLFWQQGRFNALYLPLQLRRQPFFIGGDGADAVLCLDLQHPALQATAQASTQDAAEALFQPDGQESATVQSAKACLAALLQGEQQQQQLTRLLQQLDLIQPLSLEITFADQQQQRLNGLYTIDQQKLAALSAEAVLQLHQGGWLAAIYTQLASLAQLYPLIERKNASLRMTSC
jgi:hypothetical protein